MKIRYDFVTNSSSTSYVIISDGEFKLKDFLAAVGIDKSSPFMDVYISLYESFNGRLELVRMVYNKRYSGKYRTFEDFIKGHFWNSSAELYEKILDAESKGFQVQMGELRSDDEIECFFCTDDFIIQSDKIYIDARTDGW